MAGSPDTGPGLESASQPPVPPPASTDGMTHVTPESPAPTAIPEASNPRANDRAAGSLTPDGGSPLPEPDPGASMAPCAPRPVVADDGALRMHHVHFNTRDPAASIAFVERFFSATAIDFCTDEAGSRVTRAAKTERAYFLYTPVDAPPSDMRLNRLAHIGFNTPDVEAELTRLLTLDAPLADASVCATAAQGTPCNTFTVQWFYVDNDEGARFEIASGPGPSQSGFAHLHLVEPSYPFFEDVLGAALQDPRGTPHVDGVNMVDSGRSGVLDPNIVYEDTRGAAVDHVGFSTTDLEGAQDRIEAAGIAIEEPISFKDDYGFRSFMLRSPEGVWVEIVEDSPFM